MQRIREKILLNLIIIIVLIIAELCDSPIAFPLIPKPVGIVFRGMILISLLLIWSWSLHVRILKSKVKAYFMGIAGLLLFSVPIDVVRRHILDFFPAADMMQVDSFLCSIQYIVIEFVPLCMFFISCYIGERESYNLSVKQKLFIPPTIILTILALTNRYHGFLYTYNDEMMYDWNFGYFLGVGWSVFQVLLFFTLLYKKNRIPHKKKSIITAIFIASFMISYAVFISANPEYKDFWKYESYIFMLVIIAVLESILDAGLIATNTKYQEIFECSTIAMLITDQNYNRILSSDFDRSIPAKVLHTAEKTPVLLREGKQLSSAKISWGHLFWLEDVSELKEKADELCDVNEYLEGQKEILENKYKMNLYRNQLAEKNRLYHEVQKQTEAKQEYLMKLIESFSKTSDKVLEKQLLSRIVVLSVYFKRRSNLFFLQRENGKFQVWS